MITKPKTHTAIESNFNLKNAIVELVRVNRPTHHAAVSLADLEAMRTGRRAVPASKNGLEAVCGASCETGAM